MERLKKVEDWLHENKEKIYYVIILLFFVIAAWYAFRGFTYFKTLPPIKDGSDLQGRIFSPLILASIRFVIVMLLGIFIAMNIVAKPLKRIKVMQFEVEFSEIAKVQEKQLNQFHFISTILKQNDYFISKVVDSEDIPYERVITEIFKQYEEFFDSSLGIHISVHFFEYEEGADHFSEPEYNRMCTRMINNAGDEQISTRKKVFGEKNMMMATKKEFGATYVLLIESMVHEFTDYDKEVIKGIFEYGKIICNTVALIPSDQEE